MTGHIKDLPARQPGQVADLVNIPVIASGGGLSGRFL